jgi:hypothetical protein
MVMRVVGDSPEADCTNQHAEAACFIKVRHEALQQAVEEHSPSMIRNHFSHEFPEYLPYLIGCRRREDQKDMTNQCFRRARLPF